MLLAEWLSREKITRTDFATRVGVSPSHVTGICDGASWPSRKLILEIERQTSGEVTANDFVRLGLAEIPRSAPEPSPPDRRHS